MKIMAFLAAFFPALAGAMASHQGYPGHWELAIILVGSTAAGIAGVWLLMKPKPGV